MSRIKNVHKTQSQNTTETVYVERISSQNHSTNRKVQYIPQKYKAKDCLESYVELIVTLCKKCALKIEPQLIQI